MGGEGGAVALMALLLGAVVDYFVTEPFFMSLVSGTSFIGWDPLTVFLYLYCIPYAVSVAGVSAVVGALLRG